MSDAPELWKVVIALQATAEQKDALVDRFVDAICPDPNHEGWCDTPWAVHVIEGGSLSADEQERLRDEI
ncbi:hypothetical protein QQM39_13665 [Streptomyces sp. DT2A-34]|uniref:hypothetical protein n=1 Tax=Streptomyces sp. DT2A-34 TaxID=3051182 RepID=UPI00265C8993|nr:hypothetical protein [Streptomyces sp. DT2A-34]MDO0911854.1 hypothetical protein [Streptomyces sp. DT2A-34]